MTSGIVVDASVVVDLVLARDRATAIAERIRGCVLHAPHVIDLEVAHGIRRCWLAGLIYGSRMDEALAAALDLPINRYSHKPLLPRILALRENVTAYDGACAWRSQRFSISPSSPATAASRVHPATLPA